MKKSKLKKYIVLGIVAAISAGLILATTLIGSKKYYPFDDTKMQIVFLGDSNIANNIDGLTIPDRVAERLGCDVYNAAVGGTTAAKVNTSNYFDRFGDLFCLYSVTRIMEVEEYQVLLDSYDSLYFNEREGIGNMNMLVNIEYDKVDYVVINYGVNDYMAGIPAYSDDEPYDELTYEVALRSSVERIRNLCPDCTIILSGITYCVYANGAADEDGIGGDAQIDYAIAAQNVASEYDNVIFMDNLDLPIDAHNHTEYLLDGIHFNGYMHELYVDRLVSIITEIESSKDE